MLNPMAMWAVFEAGYRKRKTSEPSAAGDEATTHLRP